MTHLYGRRGRAEKGEGRCSVLTRLRLKRKDQRPVEEEELLITSGKWRGKHSSMSRRLRADSMLACA